VLGRYECPALVCSTQSPGVRTICARERGSPITGFSSQAMSSAKVDGKLRNVDCRVIARPAAKWREAPGWRS
jgi:hypothetical protein